MREFAEAFEEGTGDTWVDGAIAGSGSTARPIIISRLLGGDPMVATQLNHGRQAEELIEAGMMTDLTELAEEQGWRDLVNPPALPDACTLNGRVYRVPVNIHSGQWLWLSHGAYEKAGVPVPADRKEFLRTAPELEEAGLVPLAPGQEPWQQNLAFGTLQIAIAGVDA